MARRYGRFAFFLPFFVMFLLSLPCRAGEDDALVLRQWQAGATVSAEAVEAYGLDSCFVAVPIPDAVWERMQGKTYKPNPHIGRSGLRYVRALHWDLDQQIHVGEMVCNEKIAERLVTIFRTLFDNHYPIERMVLPDNYDADDERQMQANNSSCFCYRNVSGSQSLSKHAMGMAVDINTLYNPYIRHRKDGTMMVEPSTAMPYVDRTASFPYKIDTQDLAYRLFVEQGFIWGGSWQTVKDYQHFEIR